MLSRSLISIPLRITPILSNISNICPIPSNNISTMTKITNDKWESELQKLFKNVSSAVAPGSTSWEQKLLDGARDVTGPPGLRMLDRVGLNAETETPFQLFDNACGVGIVAGILQRTAKPGVLKQSSILSGDFSEQVIGLVRDRAEKEGWVNTEVRTVDAQVGDPVNEPLQRRKPGLTLTWTTV